MDKPSKRGMAVPRRTKSADKPRLVHLVWLLLLLALVPFACNFPLGGLVPGQAPIPTEEEPGWVFNQPTRRPPPTPEIQEPAPTQEFINLPSLGQQGMPVLYYTQAGDTLTTVATRFGVLPEEITSTEKIPSETFFNPGQLLLLPDRLEATTFAQKVIPDSEVVYSPSAIDFDITGFVNAAGGYLSTYKEFLGSSGTNNGADVIRRVAIENSINPRLLLSLLEYRSGWVYGQPGNAAQTEYPLGLIDANRRGLYKQLMWAVNQLSIGYYAWREGRLTELRFSDGSTARMAPDLNAGTAALQFLFSKTYTQEGMTDALSQVSGLPALQEQMYGSPWLRAQVFEPLFPPDLAQPDLILPFTRSTFWAYTGGPHGAWEGDGAWAALDFAPGTTEPGCTISYSWATAAAAGLVVRSERGVVVIDLDGDGYEQTGWALLYLHIAEIGRVPVGTLVEQGDRIGYPSCEGGLATGTHIHIARKYNGEWIPADGPLPFVLGGWRATSSGAPYKGTLVREGTTITASELGSSGARIFRGAGDP